MGLFGLTLLALRWQGLGCNDDSSAGVSLSILFSQACCGVQFRFSKMGKSTVTSEAKSKIPFKLPWGLSFVI